MFAVEVRTMRRVLSTIGVVVALTGGGFAQRNRADVDLQGAIRTETVDGDLQKAVRQYQAIVSTHASDRAIVAAALVHMADCYQKLGGAQAQQIYERVVREYGDQPQQVALARARLGTARKRPVLGDRAVWTGDDVDVFGRISPDGRFLTYVDWINTGNVMVRDLDAGTDRALTSKKTWNDPGEGSWSTISRDGRLVAYGWNDYTGHIGVRIAPLQPAAGMPHDRQVASFSDKEVRFVSVLDWSPDGRSLAVTLSRTDGTGQIGVLSVEDGSFRGLKSMTWIGPERLFFSGDGKYIAYDLPAANGEQRDIFMLAVDASREVPLVVHAANDVPLGWSPDGTRLVFRSDRTGSDAVWAMPVRNGVTGAPELLKTDVGRIFSLGITTSGTLYVYKKVGNRDVRVAPVNLTTGRMGDMVEFQTGYQSNPRTPEWSPDGKSLAYSACNGDCMVIRSIETGEARRLPRTTLLYFREPRWAPDGRSLVAVGRDDKGRDGIFSIDVRTGAAVRLMDLARLGASPQWSPDGTKLYYSKRGVGGAGFFERDMAAQADRIVSTLDGLHEDITLSPNGEFLAARRLDPVTKVWTLLLVPVRGGEPSELLRLAADERFGGMRTIVWTPDGRALLVTKTRPGDSQLLLVPVNGEPARRVDIDANIWVRGGHGYLDTGFSVTPDGRTLAFLTGKDTAEIWAIENFLP
jgi:Tol biopolymer transport system component